MNEMQIEQLLQTLNNIANSLQQISQVLASAHFSHWNTHLNQIAQKTGH